MTILSGASSPEAVADCFNVSRESLDRLRLYADLLGKWQKRINLIGPATAKDLWVRHIADALQLLAHFPPETRAIADFGSGAGIPGLVLAIARCLEDDAPVVHLFESNGKKSAFLREAARLTGARICLHAQRIESVKLTELAPLPQIVTARAFAPLPKLVPLVHPLSQKGAICLFHKGQDVDTELTETQKYWKFTSIKHPSRTARGGCILEIREIISATA